MKNIKLAITLIASALTLTQAGYAAPEVREWAEYFAQQRSQSAQEQVQPQTQPGAPACTTINKQELADAIKAAVAEAVAVQKTAQKQPTTEHRIMRKDKETHIFLHQDSNDIYSVTLHEGDELILHTHTGKLIAHSNTGDLFKDFTSLTGTWVIDVITSPIYSGILRYTNMIVAESYPTRDSMYFEAHKEGYTTLKFRYLLPDGTSNTQELNVTVVYAGPPLDGDQPLPTSSSFVPAPDKK